MPKHSTKNIPVSRLLTREQAAQYCGISLPTFLRLSPIPAVSLGHGRRLDRYDLRGLDEWIDKLSTSCGEESDIDWLSQIGGENVRRPR